MNLKTKVKRYAVDIVSKLQEAGFEAYIVGGAVRDLYLGRTPKDYDISTAATPEEVRKVFGRRKARIIGKRFKIVHLRVGREIVEISTFRRRPENHQKRKPLCVGEVPEKMIFTDNEYGTVEEDSERRDFTVNSLYYDPVHDVVKDFSEKGLDDIHDQMVRVIGDPMTRFEEDPVRLLRALKLVGQYGFKMCPETEKALKKSIKLIQHSAPARLSLELEKILLSPYCVGIFDAFYRFGLLKYFLPFIHRNWDTPPGLYMQQLLRRKNERIFEGKYRNSISVSIAAMVLPFVEMEVGFADNGALWENYSGVSSKIRKVLMKSLEPLTFCKLVTASSVRMLLLQPDLVEGDKEDLLSERGYGHARELLIIQNDVMWKDEELEEAWPRRGERSHREVDSAGPKKRKRRRRYRGPKKAN